MLRRYGPDISARVVGASAILAFALLLIGYSLPIMHVRNGDRYTEATLATGPELLLQTGDWELALALFMTLHLMPVLQVLLLAITALERRVAIVVPRAWRIACLKLLPFVRRWSMLEIFLMGVFIAWTRLSQWLTVTAAPALLAVFGAVVVTQVVSGALTSRRLEGEIPRLHSEHLVPRESEPNDHWRSGVARAGALTISGYLFYIPANLLPIMTVRRLNEGGPMTILSGVRELLRDGSWVLALIVFLASVAVPLLKLFVLSGLLIMTQRRSSRGLRQRTQLFRLIESIGRWSMLDIFVLSLLVGLVRLGVLGYVAPEPGALAFCAVVIVTMLATELFEPKWMWDAAGQNGPAGTRVSVGVTTS